MSFINFIAHVWKNKSDTSVRLHVTYKDAEVEKDFTEAIGQLQEAIDTLRSLKVEKIDIYNNDTTCTVDLKKLFPEWNENGKT